MPRSNTTNMQLSKELKKSLRNIVSQVPNAPRQDTIMAVFGVNLSPDGIRLRNANLLTQHTTSEERMQKWAALQVVSLQLEAGMFPQHNASDVRVAVWFARDKMRALDLALGVPAEPYESFLVHLSETMETSHGGKDNCDQPNPLGDIENYVLHPKHVQIAFTAKQMGRAVKTLDDLKALEKIIDTKIAKARAAENASA